MSVYVHLNAHKFGRGFASGLLNCSKRAAQPLGSDFPPALPTFRGLEVEAHDWQ